MRYRSTFIVLLAACAVSRAQIPQQINYQGRILQGTNLVNGNVALSLRVYNVPSGGSILYEDSNTVAVADGLYATRIGDGTTSGTLTNALTNDTVYLETVVNGTTLSPREQLLAVPFALRALDPGLKGYRENGAFDVSPVASGTNSIAHGFGAVASGSRSTVGGGYSNRATQTGGTVAGGQVNTASGFQSAIGGGINNVAASFGATIAGGAGNLATNFYATVGGGLDNIASNDYATVAGGTVNEAIGYASIVGGGEDNRASGSQSTIAGGIGNDAGGDLSFIGGGTENRTPGAGATVGGGYRNTADFNDATVAGGNSNTSAYYYAAIGGGIGNKAAGEAATVPGGANNQANGDYSFAAGHQALATNSGSFVWADSTGSNFASTASNQFSIRANGGVRIQGTAAIGVTTNVPQVGFAYVASQSGNPILFQHPTTNLFMQWFTASRILEVYNTNSAGSAFVANINLSDSSTLYTLFGTTYAIGPGDHLGVTNDYSQGSWDVCVTPYGVVGPGFTFRGNNIGGYISGLVTYWK